MKCNKMFRAYCEFMTDAYGGCETHMCLVDLLGKEEMIRKCEFVGLDKEYPEIWEELVGEKGDAK